ncbi:MAG: ATP:cob(I)alamin adenosyltransferase [Clostridia bacterium]|nr:ATP:cob(I)alamin adenosyltransferase [Clostridia bacterium]
MNEILKGNGDDGKSTLSSQFKISKSDPRFSAIGVLDELSSAVYLCLSAGYRGGADNAFSEEILSVLGRISDGIAFPRDKRFAVTENEILRVNEVIASLSRFNAYGTTPENELSARLNMARTIARRAERELVAADLKYGSPAGAVKYLNRLSKYFEAEVRRANAEAAGVKSLNLGSGAKVGSGNNANGSITSGEELISEKTFAAAEINENLIEKAVRKIMGGTIGLGEAKALTEKIEKEAERRGKKAVIAICNEQGNPVSVHVMDGAYLVSFDVAVKKAYTAVALKMPTIKLAELVKPGATFYGLSGDKIITIGGGVPLERDGKVIGGLGVSGGTGEEDNSLCEYALSVFDK